VGEGKLMTHNEPCSMAPDDKHDLISGTCSHLPYRRCSVTVSRTVPHGDCQFYRDEERDFLLGSSLTDSKYSDYYHYCKG
ncbi:hypothetical protein CGQ17_17280, partial [Enterobacter cloacae]